MDDILAQIKAIWQQRDELLAAAKEVMREVPNELPYETYYKLSDAIVRAEKWEAGNA